MNSFFRSIQIAFAGLVLAASAHAQTTTTCTNGCPMPMPTVPSMGLTVQGWVQSGAIGFGETSGVGQHVTGQVVTQTDELFKLGADTFLTGNANPGCAANCSDSQSKLSIQGFSTVGAASVGYADFNGSTCTTGGCPAAASSVSKTGTNGMFKSSLLQQWTGTSMPNHTVD